MFLYVTCSEHEHELRLIVSEVNKAVTNAIQQAFNRCDDKPLTINEFEDGKAGCSPTV